MSGVRPWREDLLPDIDVVKGDPFNSSPTNPELMGPDVFTAYKAGKTPEVTQIRIPMVEVPLGTTEDRICGRGLTLVLCSAQRKHLL